MTNTLIDTIVGKIAADLMDRVEADGFCLHKSSIEDVCRKVLSVELHRPVVIDAMIKARQFNNAKRETDAYKQAENLTASEIKARYKAMLAPKVPQPIDWFSDLADLADLADAVMPSLSGIGCSTTLSLDKLIAAKKAMLANDPPKGL